jgi:hypothetical protein
MFVDKIAVCKDICDEFSGFFTVAAGPDAKSRLDEVVNSFAADLSNISPPVIDGIFGLSNHHQKSLGRILMTTFTILDKVTFRSSETGILGYIRSQIRVTSVRMLSLTLNGSSWAPAQARSSGRKCLSQSLSPLGLHVVGGKNEGGSSSMVPVCVLGLGPSIKLEGRWQQLRFYGQDLC